MTAHCHLVIQMTRWVYTLLTKIQGSYSLLFAIERCSFDSVMHRTAGDRQAQLTRHCIFHQSTLFGSLTLCLPAGMSVRRVWRWRCGAPPANTTTTRKNVTITGDQTTTTRGGEEREKGRLPSQKTLSWELHSSLYEDSYPVTLSGDIDSTVYMQFFSVDSMNSLPTSFSPDGQWKVSNVQGGRRQSEWSESDC